MRIFCGSTRPPAPILLATFTPLVAAAPRKYSFGCKLSMQSSTQSNLVVTSSIIRSGVRNSFIAVSCNSGFISCILVAITSALWTSTVLFSATIWRFLLEGSTRSPSTIVILPIPARHKNSAAKLPTPPIPTTKTLAPLSLFSPSEPINNSVRCNQSDMIKMNIYD